MRAQRRERRPNAINVVEHKEHKGTGSGRRLTRLDLQVHGPCLHGRAAQPCATHTAPGRHQQAHRRRTAAGQEGESSRRTHRPRRRRASPRRARPRRPCSPNCSVGVEYMENTWNLFFCVIFGPVHAKRCVSICPVNFTTRRISNFATHLTAVGSCVDFQ